MLAKAQVELHLLHYGLNGELLNLYEGPGSDKVAHCATVAT